MACRIYFHKITMLEQVIQDLYQQGLYEKTLGWCSVIKYFLRTEGMPHGSVLRKAMSLCAQEKGSCRWPDISEEYWRYAIGEMIG